MSVLNKAMEELSDLYEEIKDKVNALGYHPGTSPAILDRLGKIRTIAAVSLRNQHVESFDLNFFSELSRRRAIEDYKNYDNVELTFWTTALAGEVGELCNMVKKIRRAQTGGLDTGHSVLNADITKEMLAEEIGDIFIYLNLLSQLMGIDMRKAIIDTFNARSKEIGSSYTYGL